MSYLLFDVYPYVALTVFLLGCLFRFDKGQYSWKSESSQLLAPQLLRWGSNLFHLGILGLFFGHLLGLLTPQELYHRLGLSSETKQLWAMIAGGVMGTMCLIGLLLLFWRRLGDGRLRARTQKIDWLVQLWILATLMIGLISIIESTAHLDGKVMVALSHWAQSIVFMQGHASQHLIEVPLLYRVHLWMGMTLFVLFPFSRLVHIWSGFGTIHYVFRPYQIVRKK